MRTTMMRSSPRGRPRRDGAGPARGSAWGAVLLVVAGALGGGCSEPGAGGTTPGGARGHATGGVAGAGGAAAVASPSATPEPSPTPIEIRGSVVIKLPRGADVASGLPVHLLDREALESAALREALALGEELRRRRRELMAGIEAARAHEQAIRAGAADVLEAWGAAWRESVAPVADAAPTGDAAFDRAWRGQYRRVVESSEVAFLEAPPGVSAHVAEAVEQASALEELVRAEWARLAVAASQLHRNLESDLDEQRDLLERTYRHRADLRATSERRILELERSIAHNPHARLRDALEAVRAAAAPRAAPRLAEVQRLHEELNGTIAPSIAAARAWIERDHPRRQVAAFEKAVEEAKRDVFYADKDGGFRFVWPPGEYVLFARYVDTLTGLEYVWLLPAKGGEQTLSTYNTITDVTLEDLPRMRALLFGGAGGGSAADGASVAAGEPGGGRDGR